MLLKVVGQSNYCLNLGKVSLRSLDENVLLIESSDSWEDETRGKERRHGDAHKSLVLPASTERH